jgi:hypothetical protein
VEGGVVSANPMVLNTVLDSCSDVAEFGRIAEATIANSHGDEDAVQVRKIARFTCAPENHGERLWVSKAMGELCAAAAATLPEELAGTTLSADDLPWPSGTVVFETPLFVVPEGFVEYALGEGPIDVIQWSSDSQGVFMVAWQSRHGSEPLGFPRYLPRFAFQLPYGLMPEGADVRYCLPQARESVVDAAPAHRTDREAPGAPPVLETLDPQARPRAERHHRRDAAPPHHSPQ